MEVVEVTDFQCHSDGEEVVLLDLDKRNDPDARDGHNESDEVHEVTVGIDDVHDVGESKDSDVHDVRESRDGDIHDVRESKDGDVHDVVESRDGDVEESREGDVQDVGESRDNHIHDVGKSRDNDEGESRDDSVTTTTSATEIDVVETCEGVSQSAQVEEIGNIVELISNASNNEVTCNNSIAEVDGDDSQSSVVEESDTQVPANLENLKKVSLEDNMNMLFLDNDTIENAHSFTNESEVTIDVNNCEIVIEETNESFDIDYKTKTILDQASDRENVTIETKNPDGSIVVKNDKMTVTIPQHIAGRDITALNEDTPSLSGKRMLKPRFGVKVPYIHMTSQIVTQDEIAQELFERFQQKYPLTRVDKSDNLYSMKLSPKLTNQIESPKSPNKKLKDNVTKNLQKVKKELLNKKLNQINSTSKISLNTSTFTENTLSENTNSNMELSNVSNESMEVDATRQFDQITNTLQSIEQLVVDQNNMSDKNVEKITSNEELIAILEDFETIETADTNGNKVADTNIIKVIDANIIQVINASDIKVEDSNNQAANSIVVATNGKQLPETPKLNARRQVMRSTTRTKRCKPKLDPEIEKQIALKQLQEVSRPKRFDSQYSKRKTENDKKAVKNDSVSAQKRKKTSDDVPEVKIAIDHYIKSYTDKRQSTVKVEPVSNDETVSDKIESETKPNNVTKSRTMREINRLLGDEGAINMIYSLEKRRSPGNSNSMNILPSPRRMKKDLMLKTKLVKNAMLKMSAPTSSPMSTNRLGRRSDVCTPSPSPENKCTRKTSIDSQGSDHSITFSGRKTILGNESKIIRKHSSSSEASSVDGSPIHLPPSALPINNETTKPSPVKALRVYTRKSKKIEDLSTSMDQSLNEVSKGTNKSIKAKNNANQKVKKQPVSSKMSRSLAESITHEVENPSYNEITVRKYDGVVHITLTPVTTVMKNALNVSVMEELMKELNSLENDDTCKVVLVSSAGRIFCQGLDVSHLIHDDPEKCKQAAVEISSTLKKFIMCLSDFPKLLVAGVDGAAVGLGATMLVHFDLVFASDKATFETPYAQLGHIAEGAATTILGRLLVAELIMGSQRLTAGQAHYYGLVTRTLWPDRFHDELVPLVKALARQSLQAMKMSKALQKQETKEKLAKALESETHILVQQWTGNECQQNLQTYLKDAVDNINN